MYLTESEAVVTLVKQGEIIGNQAVGRSDDLCKDVEEGLARFGSADNLPSRIILYDGNIDLESAKQTLINYDWQDTVNFLHFPKIEDLDAHSTITAIAIAGGAEVAKSLGIQVGASPLMHEDKVQSNTLSPAEMGFFDPRKDNEAKPIEPVMIGDNFHPPHTSPAIPINPQPIEEVSAEPRKAKLAFKLPALPKWRLPNIRFARFSFPPILIIGCLILALGIVAGFVAYWQLPRAEVTIYTLPRIITKDITFTLDPAKTEADYSQSSIPAVEESIVLEGEKEVPTTGTKVVGEKAHGKINIFNLTQSTKTFDTGTKVNFDKFMFTTNEAVTVASATAEISSDYKTIVTPSQEAVQITATNIGDQYNFSKDTELTIASFAKSSFVAKASSDFTGGFSREIQAVSKDDQVNLKKTLTDELKNQGIKNLSVIASQKKGVVEMQDEEVENQTFSAEVGEEKDLLRLVLKFKQPLYTYQLAEVGMLLKASYSADFPADFVFSQDNVSVTVIKSTPNPDGTVLVSAKVDLNLVPKLDTVQIAETIRGKYPKATVDYFKGLPNFSKVETVFSTNLPATLATFPRRADHITITIKSEGQ